MSEHIHDKGYKRLLSNKKYFHKFISSFIVNTDNGLLNHGYIGEPVDEDSLEQMNASFVTKDFDDREADLIYKAKLNGSEVYFYFLLELQSSVDFTMPIRLLSYIYLFLLSIFKDTDEATRERKDFRLPVVIPCVLFNGSGQWTAVKSLKEYFKDYEKFGEYVLDFEYIFIDVNAYSDEDLLETGNIISSVFLLDKKQDLSKLLINLGKVMKRLSAMSESEQLDLTAWLRDVLLKKAGGENILVINDILRSAEKGDDNNMTYAIERLIDELREESETRGKEIGEFNAKRSVAKNLMLLNLNISDISKATGLSLNELETLAKNTD